MAVTGAHPALFHKNALHDLYGTDLCDGMTMGKAK